MGARKALKKSSQKLFNKIETQWYVCGTASNDPNYSNMVRNGGQSVSDMLAESQSGLTSWINTNLEGCKPDHIKRAHGNAEKLFNFIKKRACSFVNDIHC